MQSCSIGSSPDGNCTAASFYTESLDIWPGHFYETWSALLLLIVSTVSVCSHIWAERQVLVNLAISLASRVRSVDTFNACAVRRSSKKPRKMDALCSKIVQEMLDDRRINNFRTFARSGAPGSALLFILAYIMYGRELGMILPGSEDCLALVCFYILCLVAKFGPWPLTPSLVDKFGFAMSVVLMTKLCRGTGSAIYYGYANTRMAFRLGIGLCTLNHKIQGPLNVLIGLIESYKNIYFGSQIKAVWVMPVMVVATEIFTGLTCWFLIYIIQKWVEEGLVRVLDARAASNKTTGVQRMLAVLCDAQVTLCLDGRITAGVESLSCILMSSLAGAQASSKYKGLPFVDLVCESDRPRFREFIFGCRRTGSIGAEVETCSSTSGPSSNEKFSKPAASLRVHMLDSAVVKFPVKLFHVVTSAIDGSAVHLLGLRDVESHNSAPPPADASSVVCSELGFEVRSQRSPLDSQLDDESASFTQRVLVKRPEEDLTPRVLHGGTAWKMGAPSCKSISEIVQPKWREVKELQAIKIGVDAFSKGFAINQACFDFQTEGEASAGAKLPSLCEWLGRDKEKVTDWLCAQVNYHLAGVNIEANELKDVRFRLPGSPSVTDGMLASRAYLTVQATEKSGGSIEGSRSQSSEAQSESSESSCSAGLGGVNVQLVLEGFSVQVPTQKKNGSLKSVRSGSSRSSLPAIKESQARTLKA